MSLGKLAHWKDHAENANNPQPYETPIEQPQKKKFTGQWFNEHGEIDIETGLQKDDVQ